MKNRYKMLIAYMITHNYAPTQRDLAYVLGYKNPTTLSQIVNGKIETSPKFLKKLKQVAPEVNIDWLTTGEGEMLITDGKNVMQGNSGGINQQNVHGPNTATNVDSRFIEIFQEQTRQLSTAQQQVTTAQQQITELIQILKKQ